MTKWKTTKQCEALVDYFAPLQTELVAYLDSHQIEKIRAAYLVAKAAHEGQIRVTGEPYITHPVAVAAILAQMRLDSESLMAALLHDVLEDTAIDRKTLAKQFGEKVVSLVDGVSKLTQIEFASRAEAQAENFRKMLLAMASDLRVILVKLADRLHNMRTIGILAPERRRRIAQETLDIYAPIANRLGMHNFRVEFEELGFLALHPVRYRVLKESVRKARGNRKEILSVIEKSLQACLLKKEWANCNISGREKHLYSIYRKMRNKRIPFSEIMDVYAFRIVVEDIDSCYLTLGAVHNLYKPVPERFKDYIAIPKANGYQSLHTTLFGPYGVPIEIQIRTKEMDRAANSGIASHWLYKAQYTAEPGSINNSHVRAQEWLRGLLEMQESTGNSLEFIENVKIDLFPDEVYVFTPKGTILELPHGATLVDFAYTIHTDIGNTCVAAKINRRLASLNTALVSGQTVEIITSPGAQPNPAWLNFVVTGKAQSSIKHYLKKQRTSESMALGRRLIERALSTLSLTLSDIPAKTIQAGVHECGFNTLDDLFEATGLGTQVPVIVARRLACAVKDSSEEEEREKRAARDQLFNQPLLIKGTEGMVVSFAECCQAIPGDVIVGLLEPGRGIVIHRANCKTLKIGRYSEKAIFLSWQESVLGEFETDIKIETINKRGVLASLAMVIANAQANIENIAMGEGSAGCCNTIFLTVSVRNRDHLAKLMRKLRRIKEISRISRTH